MKLRKRKIYKLRSKAGETITETLVALLISAFALVMLAGAISSAVHVITTSDKKMGKYYAEDSNLVTQSAAKGTLSISIQQNGSSIELHNNVPYYENSEFSSKPVVSYKVTP